MKRNLTATNILVGLNIFVYLAIFLLDNNMTTITLINWGAKINFKLADGEFWRFVTPMFLHGSLPHLFFNSYALYYLGNNAERYLKWKRFLLVYFFTGILATAGSSLFSDYVSVGASGAIFGLLGIEIFRSTYLPKEIRKMVQPNYLSILIINIGFGFLIPSIDNAAHITGFIAGVLAGMLIGRQHPRLPFNQKLMASVLSLIILSLSLVNLYAYKQEIDYYIVGIQYSVETNDYEAFVDYLQRGLEAFPNNETLNSINNQMNLQ